MCAGITTDLDEIQEVSKTAIISEGLDKHSVDIVAVRNDASRNRLLTRIKIYLFLVWRDEPRQHGVGFTVKNEPLGKIKTPVAVFFLALCAYFSP